MSPSLDQVTVVCVTYNSTALAATLGEGLKHFPHVIIIDNASSDNTAAAVSARLPQTQIIQRASNGGFGKANNEAVAQVRTPYALLLNPDCQISPQDVLALLATFLLYPGTGVTAPQSWLGSNRPQISFRPAFYEHKVRLPFAVPDGACSSKWLHGCCLLVNVLAFRQIGGFDERFFLYYEDDDLCLRMHGAGFDCIVNPSANAHHLGGASSTPHWKTSFRKHFHYARSRHLAITKYTGQGAGRIFLLKTIVFAPFAVIVYSVLLRGKYALKWTAWGLSALKSSFGPVKPVEIFPK